MIFMIFFWESNVLLRTCALMVFSVVVIPASLPRADTPPATSAAEDLDRKLILLAKEGSEIKNNLTYLCDEIGPRLTGSANLKRAVEWAANRMKSYGLSNVHLEAWSLPEGWERGPATARIVEPNTGVSLSIASMAWAPGTPGKVLAEVAVVKAKTSEELAAYKGKLKGAVILSSEPAKIMSLADIDKPSPRVAQAFTPEKTPQKTPQEIAAFNKERSEFYKQEGVVALVMDAGKPLNLLNTTGGFDTKERTSASSRLPSVFMGHEHYSLLYRLASRTDGPRPKIELDISNRFLEGPIAVNNVVGEIRGTDKADEIVVVGGHIDSWDLAQGATDNATGTSIVLETARILIKSGFKPRRTIRFVLFSGEEQGLHGSKNYVEQHKDELPKITAALVHDTGTGKVVGIGLRHRPVLRPLLEKELASLKDIGLTDFQAAFIAGSDHASFDRAGVPGLMFWQENAGYRLSHHSQVDTVDRTLEPDLIQGAQVMAVSALRIANLNSALPRDKELSPREKMQLEKEKEKDKEKK